MSIPYITYREPNKDGVLQYFVLQKSHPHYVGKLTGYTDEVSLLKVPISGYALQLNFHGVLRGRYLPAYKGVDEDLLIEFQKMAQWFLDERILKDEKRYKKFKI